MMKKNIVSALLFVLLGVGSVFSQAKPTYTQYVLNNYILNPGVTGIENYTDVKVSHRNQWTGITGAPVTTYVSIHGAIGKADFQTSATSFQVPGVNPRGKQYWESYTAPEPHHGIGMVFMNDKAGYINRWSLYGSYAYHKPLAPKLTLSAGFMAGLTSVNLDRSKVSFGDPLDRDDIAIGISSGELKKLKPELGAGLWLYSHRYYIGVSVLNIIPGKVRFVRNDKYGSFYTPNYFFTAGYRMQLNDDVSLLPSVMVQYWKPQLLAAHVNAKFQYRDLVWLGGGYRFSNLVGGYSAMAGMHVSNTFNVSYAYEVATTSRLRNYTGNSHEIMLGFILGNKYGDLCPRNVW